MDGFEFNKIACSVLLSFFMLIVINLGVNGFLHITEHKEENIKGKGLVYAPEKVNSSIMQNVSQKEKTNLEIKSIESLLESADEKSGKKVAKKCLQCHTFNQGGKNKLGPNLWGVFESKIGRLDNFSYSKALSSKEGNWTSDNLNAFLKSPQKFAKGTRMSFAGLKKEKDRANIIKYMMSLKN